MQTSIPRILLAVDDSQASVSMLAELKRRRWPEHTALLIVSVAMPSLVSTSSAKYPSYHGLSPSMVRMQFLNGITNRCVIELKDALNLTNVQGIVTEGVVAKSLLRLAKTWHADEIFIGCRNKNSALSRSTISISDEILKGADCSVTVLRQRRPQSR